jgi:3-oxoacyl-[acyl-carrier-protein] synthase II
MRRRVVITGIGLCTPLGCETDVVWRRLLAGQSGVRMLERFDVRSFPIRIGGEVRDLDEARVLHDFSGVVTDQDRKVWLGLDAARRAVADTGLPEMGLADAPLFFGVSLETFHLEGVAPVARDENPLVALTALASGKGAMSTLQTPLSRIADLLGARYGLRGGRLVNCSACAAGAQAVGQAFRHLRNGFADIALAGASDSILNPLGLGGFSLLQVLSAENDQPETACRPFDRSRQGTVLSEGAAFLILEDRERALQRGARVYAEVIGYGSTMDAYRVSDPHPGGLGAIRCMRRALVDASVEISAIDSINAHGTGTPKNDLSETLAIKEVFGARAYAVPMTANKSMTGHMIAASGAAEAATSALTLFHRRISPTINLKESDPQCDLDYVTEGSREFLGHTVLSNSFGFGGQNATLIFAWHHA